MSASGRLSWERKAKKANRVATTPNATTLYGAGFYDLSKEPVVITVGDIKDHYWSIQLWTTTHAGGISLAASSTHRGQSGDC